MSNKVSQTLKKAYKQGGFLTKILKYGLLYYLLFIIMRLFNISNYYLQIVFIATVISIFSRLINSWVYNYKFKINFNLFIWTLVYIIVLFFIKEIYKLFSSKFIIEIIFVATSYVILINLIKKIEYYSLCAFVILISLIFVFFAIFGTVQDTTTNPYSQDTNSGTEIKTKIINAITIKECSDGTDYNECSYTKPYYCLDGNLIEKPEKCGCAYEFVWALNKCVSIYETNPKEINLDYTLRGKKGIVNHTVYRGLNDYLAGLERTVRYTSGQTPPTDEYMALRYITETHQKEYISQLVDKIKLITDNNDDQARIAISIVQTMPYDWDTFNNQSATGRYAYETLYNQTGVCGDKSKLLALMLKELGYGVVLFNYDTESHEAVGIKCPIEYSYKNSGYCFIESTNPSIITNSEGNYIRAGKLTSTPEIYIVSDGKSMDSVSEEYKDFQTYKKIIGKGQTLNEVDYATWKRITTKYGFRFD